MVSIFHKELERKVENKKLIDEDREVMKPKIKTKSELPMVIRLKN